MKRLFFCIYVTTLFADESCIPSQLYINDAQAVPTPPALHLQNENGVFVSGDFLYWIAREESLEFGGVATPFVPNNDTSPSTTTEYKQPHFQWDPGFRVGLGYRLLDDDWEIMADWTRFHNHAPGHSKAGSESNIEISADGTLWFPTNGTTAVTADWALHFDLLEAGFSRSFFLGKNIDVALRYGAAGAWIDQTLKVEYPNSLLVYSSELPSDTTDLKLHFYNNFHGGGLFLDLRPEWRLNRTLSIIGDFSTYVLHGQFLVHQKSKALLPPGPSLDGESPNAILDFKKTYSRNRIGVHGALGIQWETCPTNHASHLSIRVMYEGLVWFKQNLLSNPFYTFFLENLERRGDLEMQGLSVSARIDF